MQFHEFSILLTEPASFEEIGDILGGIYKFLEKEDSIATLDAATAGESNISLFVGTEDATVDEVRLKIIESFSKTSRSADNFILV